MNTDDAMLTTKQLARILRCSELTVRRMVYDKEIPAYRVRHTYRYDLDEVRKALLRGVEQTPLLKTTEHDTIVISNQERVANAREAEEAEIEAYFPYPEGDK